MSNKPEYYFAFDAAAKIIDPQAFQKFDDGDGFDKMQVINRMNAARDKARAIAALSATMQSADLTREKMRAAFNADRNYPAALTQDHQGGGLREEITQCALELEEAANVFDGTDFPALARVYRAAATRARSAVAQQPLSVQEAIDNAQ